MLTPPLKGSEHGVNTKLAASESRKLDLQYPHIFCITNNFIKLDAFGYFTKEKQIARENWKNAGNYVFFYLEIWSSLPKHFFQDSEVHGNIVQRLNVSIKKTYQFNHRFTLIDYFINDIFLFQLFRSMIIISKKIIKFCFE